MPARLIGAIAIAATITLAGCSAPPAGEASQAASPSASPHSAAANGVSQDQWLGAVASGDSQTVIDLLAEPGAAEWVDQRDDDGVTALLHAAKAGDAALVAALLDAGADPVLRELKGFPTKGAMHIAAAQGDLAVLQVLLDHGVDVNTLDGASGHALLWAAYKGQADAVTLLIDAGSDIALVDGSGMNASERAAGEGYADIAAQIAAAMPAE